MEAEAIERKVTLADDLLARLPAHIALGALRRSRWKCRICRTKGTPANPLTLVRRPSGLPFVGCTVHAPVLAARLLPRAKPTEDALGPTLPCPDCNAPMVLRRGRYRRFYGCTRFPDCKGCHAAHKDGRPTGIPATADVRAARVRAHAALAAITDGSPLQRVLAYAWLQQVLGMSPELCHIGRFGLEDCRRVIEACERVTEGVFAQAA